MARESVYNYCLDMETNTNETPAGRVASKMSDFDLMHVATTLNAEVEASMLIGRGCVADLGRLELATACTAELVKRGYLRGRMADGSDLPHDVAMEFAYGASFRLSTPIRCF